MGRAAAELGISMEANPAFREPHEILIVSPRGGPDGRVDRDQDSIGLPASDFPRRRTKKPAPTPLAGTAGPGPRSPRDPATTCDSRPCHDPGSPVVLNGEVGHRPSFAMGEASSLRGQIAR